MKKKTEYGLNLSLTKKETQRYYDWMKSLSNDIDEAVKDEDSYCFYPEFKIALYEMGAKRIEVSIGKKTLLLRTAFEDDEV